MGGRIIDLVALVFAGVMLADLVKNYTGTKVLIDGLTGMYSTSINGLLGQTGA
jgi:hypothetical protein